MALAAALTLGVAACGDEPATDSPGGGETEPGDVSADFELLEIVTIDPLDRPEATAKVDGEGPKVVALLNRLYDAAFLDPELWEDGEHSEMLGLFTEQGRTQVAGDLESVALGELAPQFERISPITQEVTKVTFFVTENLATPVGLATVLFEASATPVDDDLDPVPISQLANFWVTFDDGYKISAYSALLRVGEEGA